MTAPRCSSNASLPAKAWSLVRTMAPLARQSRGSPSWVVSSSWYQAAASRELPGLLAHLLGLGEQPLDPPHGVAAGDLAGADLPVRVVAERRLDQLVRLPPPREVVDQRVIEAARAPVAALGELGAGRPGRLELVVRLDQLAQLLRQAAQVDGRGLGRGLRRRPVGRRHAGDLVGDLGERLGDVGQLVGRAVEVPAGEGKVAVGREDARSRACRALCPQRPRASPTRRNGLQPLRPLVADERRRQRVGDAERLDAGTARADLGVGARDGRSTPAPRARSPPVTGERQRSRSRPTRKRSDTVGEVG